MTITLEDVLALEALESKLRAILPEQYRDTYESVVPVSMGSAGLKYDGEGRVAWDEMWATFCDLAMAGGPPHRGTLLEPATGEAVAAEPENHRRAVEEICRGIALVTGLAVQPALLNARPYAIAVQCRSAGMAGWLVRAIVMENVLARHDAEMLYLPSGPQYRMAKEIKNVITVVAKTCHYWTDHMPAEQQESIDRMMSSTKDSELLEPGLLAAIQGDPDTYRSVADEISREITNRTGKVCFPHRYAGWIGVECPNFHAAIWLMRAMIVDDVLARREESVLYLPVNSSFSTAGRVERLVHAFEHANRLYALCRRGL